MINKIKSYWQNYREKKSLWSKISDILFILLVIGMLIPASRKEISAFMSGLLASSPGKIKEEKQQKVTEAAWQWTVYTPEGEAVSLNQFKGKPILLNFWATWCPPCIAEMPDLQKLYDSYGQEAAFLLVTDEKPETIDAFMQKRGFDMPIYIHRRKVPDIFASNSIPTTWIIDPKGNIIIKKTGAAKWNSKSMQQQMEQMIRESI